MCLSPPWAVSVILDPAQLYSKQQGRAERTGNAESLWLHSAFTKSPRTRGESLPGESNLILIVQHD